MFHGSSSNPQIVAIECNNSTAKGNGERLKIKLTMLTRLLHDLKLIMEDGSPTTKAQNAICPRHRSDARAVRHCKERNGKCDNDSVAQYASSKRNLPKQWNLEKRLKHGCERAHTPNEKS